jgi:anti-sigma factor RsiW
MTCRELIEFLDAYLDGGLTPDELELFERHLRACTACVAYLDAYRKAIELGKAVLRADDSAVPANVPEELIAAILESRGR